MSSKGKTNLALDSILKILYYIQHILTLKHEPSTSRTLPPNLRVGSYFASWNKPSGTLQRLDWYQLIFRSGNPALTPSSRPCASSILKIFKIIQDDNISFIIFQKFNYRGYYCDESKDLSTYSQLVNLRKPFNQLSIFAQEGMQLVVAIILHVKFFGVSG